MSSYFGDITAGATIVIPNNTVDDTLTPTSIVGGDTTVIRDDQQDSNAGISNDFDTQAITGLNVFTIVATDAFYAAGHDYMLVYSDGTVDGVSIVGRVIGAFSIENRSGNRVLKVAQAQRNKP